MEYVRFDTRIADVISTYPEAIEIFEKYDMMCMSCMGASEETVLEGAVMHSVCPVSLVVEINKLIRDKRK